MKTKNNEVAAGSEKPAEPLADQTAPASGATNAIDPALNAAAADIARDAIAEMQQRMRADADARDDAILAMIEAMDPAARAAAIGEGLSYDDRARIRAVKARLRATKEAVEALYAMNNEVPPDMAAFDALAARAMTSVEWAALVHYCARKI